MYFLTDDIVAAPRSRRWGGEAMLPQRALSRIASIRHQRRYRPHDYS